MKFAFIGAGSLQFTTSCMRDLLTFEPFRDAEFALMYTNAENLKKHYESVRKNSRGYGVSKG